MSKHGLIVNHGTSVFPVIFSAHDGSVGARREEAEDCAFTRIARRDSSRLHTGGIRIALPIVVRRDDTAEHRILQRIRHTGLGEAWTKGTNNDVRVSAISRTGNETADHDVVAGFNKTARTDIAKAVRSTPGSHHKLRPARFRSCRSFLEHRRYSHDQTYHLCGNGSVIECGGAVPNGPHPGIDLLAGRGIRVPYNAPAAVSWQRGQVRAGEQESTLVKRPASRFHNLHVLPSEENESGEDIVA